MVNDSEKFVKTDLNTSRRRRVIRATKRRKRFKLTKIGRLVVIFSIGIMFLITAAICIKYFVNSMYISTSLAKVTGDIYKVSPRISGQITNINVKTGDIVSQGEVLFTLNTEQLKNQVDEDYAAMEIAFANLEKAINMKHSEQAAAANINNKGIDIHKKGSTKYSKAFKTNNISSKDYEILQNTVRAAQAKYNLAKLALSYTNVQAPVDGTVLQLSGSVGDSVSPEHEVVTLVDLSKLTITAYVKQSEIKKIKRGQRVEISIDGVSQEKFQGEVKAVGVAVGSVYNLFQGDAASKKNLKDMGYVPVTIDFKYSGNQIILGTDANVKIKIR